MNHHYGHFFGMHFLWLVIWIVLIIWIFITPYNIPFQKTKEDSPLDILKTRFAKGENGS